MVLAMVGDPADRPALRGTAADDRQNVFEPPGPQCKTAMRQQAMIGQADPDPARQPVQEKAQAEARTRKNRRAQMRAEHRACIAPIQIKEAQASRSGAGGAEVVVVMINLWSSTSRRID